MSSPLPAFPSSPKQKKKSKRSNDSHLTFLCTEVTFMLNYSSTENSVCTLAHWQFYFSANQVTLNKSKRHQNGVHRGTRGKTPSWGKTPMLSISAAEANRIVVLYVLADHFLPVAYAKHTCFPNQRWILKLFSSVLIYFLTISEAWKNCDLQSNTPECLNIYVFLRCSLNGLLKTIIMAQLHCNV